MVMQVQIYNGGVLYPTNHCSEKKVWNSMRSRWIEKLRAVERITRVKRVMDMVLLLLRIVRKNRVTCGLLVRMRLWRRAKIRHSLGPGPGPGEEVVVELHVASGCRLVRLGPNRGSQ